MSSWEKTLARYPTQLSLTPDKRELLSILLKSEFAIHKKGNQYIFAKFGEDVVYSPGPQDSWKYLEDHDTVPLQALQGWFLNHQFLDKLNPVKETATYSGKNVQWAKEDFKWKYLNYQKVHFESRSTSQESSRSTTPEGNTLSQEASRDPIPEEDNTATVEDLLQ